MAKDKLYLPYSLVRNTLPESDGYHRVLSHVRSIDGETLFAEAASKIPGQTAAGAELVWESIVDTVEENLTKHQYRTSVNGVTFALAIPGSTDSVNGTPDGEAYVSISLPDVLRNIDASVTPVYSSEEKGVPLLAQVENLADSKIGEIVGTEQFRLGGVNLTAAGDDETITVVATDGTKAVAEVVDEDGLGAFITARLSAALPAGKGKVVLMTHGKRTPEGELRTLVKSVTILVDDTPPEPPVGEPTITGAKTRGESEGSVNIAGGILDVEGTNLGTATAVELHSDVQPTGEASLWQTLPATYADGKLTTGELDFDEKPSDGGFVRVATAGGSALYPITYCAH